VIYVVGRQQFVGYIQVPSVVDFVEEVAHQGFVALFDRHGSFFLLAPTRLL
jgi:hypothetical protein